MKIPIHEMFLPGVPLIVASKYDRPLGFIAPHSSREDDGVILVDQPFMLIRRSTKEEFIASLKPEYRPGPDYEMIPDWDYFYEISVD